MQNKWFSRNQSFMVPKWQWTSWELEVQHVLCGLGGSAHHQWSQRVDSGDYICEASITVLGTPAAAQPWPSKVRYTKSLALFLLLWSGFFLSSVLSSKTKGQWRDLLAILKLAFMTCPFLCSCVLSYGHTRHWMIQTLTYFSLVLGNGSLFIFFSSGSTSCFHPEAFSNRSP